MNILIVLGTRPEIIKLAPVIHELQKRKITFSIIHTGQHYSENMDRIFWENLELPVAKYQLGIRENTHASQTAEMMKKIDQIITDEKPNWVIVHGDTNSTLSGALAAAKHTGVRIAHVEAGLRSYDRSMPEEINRVLVDHVSSLLFTPTNYTKGLLEKEGIGGDKVVITGNTIADALFWILEKALKKSKILDQLKLRKKSYVLTTVHRQENTDNHDRLVEILNSVFSSAFRHKLKVVFPIHPRTKARLSQNNFVFPEHVILCEPLGFDDFLVLEKYAALIATDSGGLQEESCILSTPCITLRENTERPETVDVGANAIAGVSKEGISLSFDKMLSSQKSWMSPYGDGHAAQIMIDAIVKA